MVSKVARVNRIEKELYQQLFEVIVVTVPELDDALREERLVGIAEDVLPEESKTTYDNVTDYGDPQNVKEKS